MSKQYIGNISSTVAGTNFTFNTDLNIGEENPARKILVFFALRTGTAESIANKVLLNDIEADIIYNKIDEQGNLHIVAYATIPGTTLNASVNLGTSYLRCVMHVYRLDNLDFLECASIMNKTTNKTTININIKPNGAILGMAVVQYSNASVNTKFSGLIKDSTLDIPYVSTMVGSTDTSEDANVEITAQFSRTGEPKTLICVSFEEKREEMTQFGKILKGNANYNIIVKNNNNYNKIMLDNTLYWKKEYVSEETKISLKNIIINADFKDGTTGFTNYVNSTIQSVQDGYLTWIKRNANTSGTYIYAGLSEELKPNHKYYARSIFNSTASSEFRGGIQYRGGTTTINKYGTYSSVPITTSFLDEITEQTQYVIDMQCGDTNVETLFQIKEPMLVDVTELYGVIGNTDEEIKNYMDNLDFFADTLNLSLIKNYIAYVGAYVKSNGYSINNILWSDFDKYDEQSSSWYLAKIPIQPNTNYTYLGFQTANNPAYFFLEEDEVTIIDGAPIKGKARITTPATAKYIIMSVSHSYINTATLKVDER